MTLTAASRTCLANYAAFSGRAPRSEYWWFLLFCFSAIAAVRTFLDEGRSYGEDVLSPAHLSTWLLLLLLPPLLGASARRVHDWGQPAWLILGGFVALLTFTSMNAEAFEAFRIKLSESGFRLSWPSLFFSSLSFVLISLLNIAAAGLVVLWLTRPSEPTANRYGPPPREVTP